MAAKSRLLKAKSQEFDAIASEYRSAVAAADRGDDRAAARLEELRSRLHEAARPYKEPKEPTRRRRWGRLMERWKDIFGGETG